MKALYQKHSTVKCSVLRWVLWACSLSRHLHIGSMSLQSGSQADIIPIQQTGIPGISTDSPGTTHPDDPVPKTTKQLGIELISSAPKRVESKL